MSSFRGSFAFILFIYVTIRTFISLRWLKLCKCIVQPMKYVKPCEDYQHKIVIIGDGFAEGMGDHVVLGSSAGISQYLTTLIRKDCGSKIRHQWQVLNCGETGTTSADWLPTSENRLFHSVFSNRAYKDAEIVLVILGSMDIRKKTLISAKETMNNLKTICDSLRKKGKKVCISYLGTAGAEIDGHDQNLRNTMIREYCDGTAYDDIPVIIGPALNLPLLRRTDSLAFDGIHFNSKSYKILAKDAFDVLLPIITSIEWEVWKTKIDTVHVDASLYQ